MCALCREHTNDTLRQVFEKRRALNLEAVHLMLPQVRFLTAPFSHQLCFNLPCLLVWCKQANALPVLTAVALPVLLPAWLPWVAVCLLLPSLWGVCL